MIRGVFRTLRIEGQQVAWLLQCHTLHPTDSSKASTGTGGNWDPVSSHGTVRVPNVLARGEPHLQASIRTCAGTGTRSQRGIGGARGTPVPRVLEVLVECTVPCAAGMGLGRPEGASMSLLGIAAGAGGTSVATADPDATASGLSSEETSFRCIMSAGGSGGNRGGMIGVSVCVIYAIIEGSPLCSMVA